MILPAGWSRRSIRWEIPTRRSLTRPTGRVAHINPLGFTWTNVFDGASRLVASVDPLGNTSSTIFDAANRPVASVNPLGFSNNAGF